MIAELLPHTQELVFSGHGAALLELLDRITPKQITDADQLNELGRAFYYLSAFTHSFEFKRASLAIAERTGDVPLRARALAAPYYELARESSVKVLERQRSRARLETQ